MHCKNIKDLSSHRHQGQCIPNRGIGGIGIMYKLGCIFLEDPHD